ncbi:IS110 family transposase [Candidatus Gottesmanbacteria bacterium]|nr:IS110 family transposase [Candidatus Gottesmanbacteria bacterium]
MISSEQLNSSLFIGIDAHKYEYTAVAANRFEEELECFRFANKPSAIDEFIQKIEALAYQKSLSPIFGIEGSGGNGMLLTKRLIGNYTQVYEVNPILTQSRRRYFTKREKTDRIDARLIVSILTRQLDSLPKLSNCYTHDAYYLHIYSLISSYEELVKERTRLKNQLHRFFHQIDPSYREKHRGVFTKKALKLWRRICYRKTNSQQSPDLTKLILWKIQRLLEVGKQMQYLKAVIKILIFQSGQKLTTMPGIDSINAARLLAYVRNIDRFTTVDKFTRYVGCVPEQNSSGLIFRHKRAKISNRKLYHTIYSIMLTQLRVCSRAKAYYQKKLSEGKSGKQARRCVMKRISSIIYGMMKHKGEYKQ